MIEEAQLAYNRITDAVENTSALARMSDLICKYTYLEGRPYSFRQHEYQIAIADTRHPNVAIRKCSQVGASELNHRRLLMFLEVTPGTTAILTLPTVGEAQLAVKSRIDPIIVGSQRLRDRLSVDSASFKQIGTSQLHTCGTQKEIISIATDMVVSDEIDFSVAENLITIESRLSHSKFVDQKTGIRGLRMRFSTPTASGIGVSGLFEGSDQRLRLLRCKCGHWFWPNFLEHAVVDGFDMSFEEMTYHDVLDLETKGKVDTARLLCPACHNEVKDLGPERREWVAMYPERQHLQGWSISPYDLPDYNTTPALMRKLAHYKSEVGHFRNFALGLPYDDASNSVLEGVVQDNTTLSPVSPELAHDKGVTGCVAGVDCGKTSWLFVGKVMGRKLHVLWVEQIKLRGQNGEGLKDILLQRIRQFRILRMVIDSMPWADVVLNLQAEAPEGVVWPCQYTLRDNKLPAHLVNESDAVVSANRTKSLNALVKRINGGEIMWPMCDEMASVRSHLKGMKRVDRTDDRGEVEQNWVKSDTADDHYFHAGNYLNIAADLFESSYVGWMPVPSISGVDIGSKAKQGKILLPGSFF